MTAYQDGHRAWSESRPRSDSAQSADPGEFERGWDDAEDGAHLHTTEFLNDRPASGGG